MSNVQIPNLPVATSLSGEEMIEVVQSGQSRRATINQVANTSTSPGGSNTQIQYNATGSFAGSSNFVYDYTNFRVGIGTSFPLYELDVNGTTRTLAAHKIHNGTTTWNLINYNNDFYINYNGTYDAIRIMPTGQIGIGTNTLTYKLNIEGSIGLTYGDINFSDAYALYWGNTWLDGYTGASGYVGLAPNNTYTLFADVNGIYPKWNDNGRSCGDSFYRWSVVYAATGSINTSDAREKQQISSLNEAEKRVAISIKGLVKKFKFNDAVATKGDNARIHVGVIAQDIAAAFMAEGLDPTKYALFCHDTWEASGEETDSKGVIKAPARPAGDRYGVRYEELLAFIISAL